MDLSQELGQYDPAQQQQLAFDRLQQIAHFQAGFLGTASHELRAPINRIIGLHQLILENLCEDPEEEREFLQQANQAIFEVLRNLDLLIQVSKFDIGAVAPKQEPVLLDGVFAKVRQFMEKKCLNRQCRLEVSAPPPDLLAESDDHWLQQLLLLLLDGALTGGCETLSLAARTVDPATIEIQLDCDIAAAHWTQQEAAKTASNSPEPDVVDISPGFRYQLAERMAKHLNCSLSCRESSMKGSEIILGLPEADF